MEVVGTAALGSFNLCFDGLLSVSVLLIPAVWKGADVLCICIAVTIN